MVRQEHASSGIVASAFGLRIFTRLLAAAGERGRPRLSVLIFHRVMRDPDPLFPNEMHAERFDALMVMVAANFNVIPLCDAIDRVTRNALPSRAVSITFDDGYADNYTIACPILKRHAMCATFFIASGFLDGGLMWNDDVIAALRSCGKETVDLEWLGLGRLPLVSSPTRREAIDRILFKLKYLSLEARTDALLRLRCETGGESPTDLMLTSGQLRKLRDEGMEIGGHTVRHPILAVLGHRDAERQIGEDRERLASVLGEAPRVFAYPNGKPGTDYGREHVEMVRKAGYAAAVSTAVGSVGGETDRYQIPRFTPWDRSTARFGLRLAQNSFRRNARTV